MLHNTANDAPGLDQIFFAVHNVNCISVEDRLARFHVNNGEIILHLFGNKKNNVEDNFLKVNCWEFQNEFQATPTDVNIEKCNKFESVWFNLTDPD